MKSTKLSIIGLVLLATGIIYVTLYVLNYGPHRPNRKIGDIDYRVMRSIFDKSLPGSLTIVEKEVVKPYLQGVGGGRYVLKIEANELIALIMQPLAEERRHTKCYYQYNTGLEDTIREDEFPKGMVIVALPESESSLKAYIDIAEETSNTYSLALSTCYPTYWLVNRNWPGAGDDALPQSGKALGNP